MNIRVRKAEEKDRKAIIALWKRLMTEEEDTVDGIQDIDEVIARWEWRLDRQIGEGVRFVVIADEDIVGFTGFVGYREPIEDRI